MSSKGSTRITARQLAIVLSLPVFYLWIVFALRAFSLSGEDAGSMILFATAGAWSPVNAWETSFEEAKISLLVVLCVTSTFSFAAWLRKDRAAAWFGFGILAVGPLIWYLRAFAGIGRLY